MNYSEKPTIDYKKAKEITSFARSCVIRLDRGQLLRILDQIDSRID